MTAPDVNADVRARFEASMRKLFGDDFIRGRHPDAPDEYLHVVEQMAWVGYRAAHADLAGEVRELVEAAEEVCRISDRKHDAWDRLKAALTKFHPTHQEKP